MLVVILNLVIGAVKKIIAIFVLAAFILLQVVETAKATVNIAIINKAGSNTNSLKSANGIPIININKA